MTSTLLNMDFEKVNSLKKIKKYFKSDDLGSKAFEGTLDLSS